jgi:hypothetical protein
MTDQAYDPKDSKFKDLMAGTGSGATRKLKGSDPAFTTRPELMGTFGMVTSTHWLATAAMPLMPPSRRVSPCRSWNRP